jgi:hypothetical protein
MSEKQTPKSKFDDMSMSDLIERALTIDSEYMVEYQKRIKHYVTRFCFEDPPDAEPKKLNNLEESDLAEVETALRRIIERHNFITRNHFPKVKRIITVDHFINLVGTRWYFVVPISPQGVRRHHTLASYVQLSDSFVQLVDSRFRIRGVKSPFDR